jgi:hypothetical protein
MALVTKSGLDRIQPSIERCLEKGGHGYLVMRGRAMDEGENLFEAMDSISSSTLECFEALFDHESGEWKKSVEGLYGEEVPGHDVVFIETIELEPAYRGKGIGCSSCARND